MKRKGTYRPTIEDAVEISGIETLHPGGIALTRRTAELTGLKNGLRILDVSSGRGTQSILYAREYGAAVTGIDISADMVDTATAHAVAAGVTATFRIGDSQQLPFADDSFDVVINECAVGIPDDSQKVVSEMMRVVKPGGKIAMHESTWRSKVSETEKDEFSERYGTTPLELDEWLGLLRTAGAGNIVYEFEEWSRPETFWKIRKDRDVRHWFFIMSIPEKLTTMKRIFSQYGLKGIATILQNERIFFRTIMQGKLGYALFVAEK